MKKALFALLTVLCLAVPLFAEDDSESESTQQIWDHGDNVSDLFYFNVPVFKVYDQKDAYVVMYQKQGLDVGKTVIPKQWARDKDHKKLTFRARAKGLSSYMTVFYKGGEFYKVVLTVSPDRTDPVWGVISNSVKISGTDADTLEIEF